MDWNNNGTLFLPHTTSDCPAAAEPRQAKTNSTSKGKLTQYQMMKKSLQVCVCVCVTDTPQPRAQQHSRLKPWGTWGYVYLCWACRCIITGLRACLQFFSSTFFPMWENKKSCYYYDSNGGFSFLARGSGAAERNSNAQKMKISGKLSSFFSPTPTLLAVCMCP